MTVAVHAWDVLKEVAIIFITSTKVWPQVNSREGTQLHPSTENWIKEQDLVSPSVSLSHEEAFITSYPSPSEGRQTESQRKLANLITWTTALSNSMELLAMPCRATQDDGSWWRVLTKFGLLEKGMTNHFSILALRTP